MLLLRALNDFDIIIDPIKNGLASKKMIYDATKRYLYNVEREKVEKMSKQERYEYIKSYMREYLINHKHKLSKIFEKNHLETKNIINNFVDNKDKFSYCQMIMDLSSLPNHLVNGSKTYTNWISASNNIDGLWNYYDSQKIHEVAVINVNTNGVFDENTYIVDLSNRETINNIRFLSNKIDIDDFDSFTMFMKENPELDKFFINGFNKYVMKPTNKKFMGFNFSASDNEYCIYEYLSKESIVSVLESLQIDLICADLFNEEYLLLNPNKQVQELKKLKDMILKHVLEEKNPYMLYVFEELYLKKHNIFEITNSKEEQEKMILMRNEIISKCRLLPSVLIKNKIIKKID